MRKFYLDFSQKTAKQNDNVSTSGASIDNNTEPKEDIKNPPNAKKSRYLPGQRSPWTDAGIGGGVGGLLGAALGYLYGHRGRWLAYDTLAGGLGGGTIGYVVGASNNSEIRDKNNAAVSKGGTYVSPDEQNRKVDEERLNIIKTNEDRIRRSKEWSKSPHSVKGSSTGNRLVDAFKGPLTVLQHPIDNLKASWSGDSENPNSIHNQDIEAVRANGGAVAKALAPLLAFFRHQVANNATDYRPTNMSMLEWLRLNNLKVNEKGSLIPMQGEELTHSLYNLRQH